MNSVLIQNKLEYCSSIYVDNLAQNVQQTFAKHSAKCTFPVKYLNTCTCT